MLSMDITTQRALAEHRLFIRAQWERLLRLDRGISPLARPDTLVYLLDTTLDEIFASLPVWSARRHPSRMPEPVCPCGRSPFLAYFAAGRQALNEGLITIQAQMPGLTMAARDEAFACLDQVFSRIARREIGAFCSLCQLHPVTHARDQAPADTLDARTPGLKPTRPDPTARETNSAIRR
jgi:hypothetical protein